VLTFVLRLEKGNGEVATPKRDKEAASTPYGGSPARGLTLRLRDGEDDHTIQEDLVSGVLHAVQPAGEEPELTDDRDPITGVEQATTLVGQVLPCGQAEVLVSAFAGARTGSPAALGYEVKSGDVVIADVVQQRLAVEPAGQLDSVEIHRAVLSRLHQRSGLLVSGTTSVLTI